MSRELASIDPHVLDNVTGGTSSSSSNSSSSNNSSSSSNIDGLLSQLNSITGSIKDIQTKTNGLSSSEMFMLCALAMQNRPASASVVYVGPRRGRW
jgi:L-asparaginase/Glu-tRNA(Gln) amidotransferase subunit D